MSLPQFRVPMTIVYTHDDGTKDVYLRKEELGHGGFAVVYRVVNQKNNRDYAIKVISKERYEGPKGQKSLEKLKNEINIQKSCNHLNIVKSYGSFSDAFNYYIILEFCPGKTIADLLRSSEGGHLSEQETRKILQDVLRALVYLHRKHIIHRDLKLENYMVGADGRVKIADFGISSVLKNDDEKRFSICGTPNYLSPELLQKVNKGHSYEVDIWAIGISAFAMLTGHPPFEGGRKQITYENIKNCQYRFPSAIQISNNAKDFIRTILRIDPDRRPTATDLLNHPFLTTFSTDPVNLNQPVNDALKDIYSPTRFIPSPLSIKSNIRDTNLNSNLNFNSNVPGPLRPRIPLPPKNNLYSPILPVRNLDNDNLDSKINNYSTKTTKINDYKPNFKKTYNLPNYFVSKISFHNKDLIYLLADGTVGICFDDRSRIVLDPNENFVQYYQNFNSILKAIDLQNFDKTDDSCEDIRISRKISLIRRYASSLKKSKVFELSTESSDSSIPLRNVKCFLNKNNTLVFKFSDKNVQVNFSDHKKLIIFSNTKQLCLVRNIKENCSLMSIGNVLSMDSNSEELKRYNVAKNLISELSKNGKF